MNKYLFKKEKENRKYLLNNIKAWKKTFKYKFEMLN